MSGIRMDLLARRIQEHRAGSGIREAARAAGVSPATLSRVENGKVPDLETFRRICEWLKEDPAKYLGGASQGVRAAPSALVHFKKGAAIDPDTARALGDLILEAQRALLEEEQ